MNNNLIKEKSQTERADPKPESKLINFDVIYLQNKM